MTTADAMSELLSLILEQPGLDVQELARRFNLSPYRLKRLFRRIDQKLPDNMLVNGRERGVWIIPMSREKCQGVEWVGAENGGFAQCGKDPAFDDGCCYDHSQCENLEMTAFLRYIAYLCGPAEPNAQAVGRLNLALVEELLAELTNITPLTRKDGLTKDRLLNVISAGRRYILWKRRMSGRSEEYWIPPELLGRHRRSSGNPFEFSVKKHFAVLEITPDATREQVVKAWRKLARLYHPDMSDGDEEKMKIVNKAKERIFIVRGWD